MQYRADGEVRKWKAPALQRSVIVIPAGHRRPLGTVAHMHRSGGVSEEESAHAVAGLAPGRRLCADNGYVSVTGGVIAGGAREGGS
ncbi:hypothetical protein [Marinobacter sp.]|uniref:hypothetical protein n=1 Tax=Marinobacter sp. TaxID=50741 RepID=UPI003299271D